MARRARAHLGAGRCGRGGGPRVERWCPPWSVTGATPSASTSGPSQTISPSPSAGPATENPKPSGPIVPWLDQSVLTAPSPTPVVIPSGTPAAFPAISPRPLGGREAWTDARFARGDERRHAPMRPRGEPAARRAALWQIDHEADHLPRRAQRRQQRPERHRRSGPPRARRDGRGVAVVVELVRHDDPRGDIPRRHTSVRRSPDRSGAGDAGNRDERLPRCDVPSAASTFTAYAFTPVAPEQPASTPQPASAVLSVPSSATAGTDLVYYVTLTNLGTQPPARSLPHLLRDLVVGGVALKLPTVQFLLLNCAFIGPALEPGTFVQLEMRRASPQPPCRVLPSCTGTWTRAGPLTRARPALRRPSRSLRPRHPLR